MRFSYYSRNRLCLYLARLAEGVNSTALTPLYDMRGDGATGSLVAWDAFGFGLHYLGNRDYFGPISGKLGMAS